MTNYRTKCKKKRRLKSGIFLALGLFNINKYLSHLYIIYLIGYSSDINSDMHVLTLELFNVNKYLLHLCIIYLIGCSNSHPRIQKSPNPISQIFIGSKTFLYFLRIRNR